VRRRPPCTASRLGSGQVGHILRSAWGFPRNLKILTSLIGLLPQQSSSGAKSKRRFKANSQPPGSAASSRYLNGYGIACTASLEKYLANDCCRELLVLISSSTRPQAPIMSTIISDRWKHFRLLETSQAAGNISGNTAFHPAPQQPPLFPSINTCIYIKK